MSGNQNYDITIVGAGPFSCFSALLLAKNGMKIALVFPENTLPMDTFVTSLNTCWPSLNDPPTRAEVAHGHEVALYLHEFCSKGLVFFKETILPFVQDMSNWQKADSLRVGLKDFEVQELEEALRLGFGLKKTSENHIFSEENSSLICLNNILFQNKMIKTLQNMNITFIPSGVVHLEESQSKCILTLKNKRVIESEIVVLGNSLNILNLMPKFQSILIPMSDCLFEYEFNMIHNEEIKLKSFRASNGHICGSIFNYEQKYKLKLSGPRFLLPGAGAGQDLTKNNIEDKVFQNVEKYHKETVFSFLQKMHSNQNMFLDKVPNLVLKKMLVDCYPCDELPILGEYGKLGRILGNTGWLATGISSGAWASKIICDLIMHEKSSDLHSRLHPRRLFTKFIKN